MPTDSVWCRMPRLQTHTHSFQHSCSPNRLIKPRRQFLVSLIFLGARDTAVSETVHSAFQEFTGQRGNIWGSNNDDRGEILLGVAEAAGQLSAEVGQVHLAALDCLFLWAIVATQACSYTALTSNSFPPAAPWYLLWLLFWVLHAEQMQCEANLSSPMFSVKCSVLPGTQLLVSKL